MVYPTPYVGDGGRLIMVLKSHILHVQNLHHRYKKRHVLKGVTFECRQGEILGFLGPNGSGKTTLFACLTGLLEVQSGKVHFHNQVTSPYQHKNQLGVLFQNPALDEKLTAWENLQLSATLYALKPTDAKIKAKTLLEQVGLTSRMHDKVSEFSGGMKRRLDISRALIHDPKLLILDEPTTGLDEAAFRSFWSLVKSLQKEHEFTALLSTHRSEEAEHCDRVAILDNGQIQVCDSPKALKRQVIGIKDIVIKRPPQLSDVFLKVTGHELC
jgi:ABC-2 type transport system ATP-binding protein